jgi:hypothetical protein
MRFHVTYERITEESAEHGDAAERGFVSKCVRLREALEDIEQTCAVTAIEGSAYPLDGSRWLTFYGAMNLETGDYVNCSLHPIGDVSAASIVRLARLLGAMGA